MSFLTKSVLTTAVIGAGLVSTAGAAFAGDDPCANEHHGHHSGHSTTVNSNNDSSCSNGVGTGDKTGNGLVGIGNVIDAPITANVCHILNDNLNNNLNGNQLNIL